MKRISVVCGFLLIIIVIFNVCINSSQITIEKSSNHIELSIREQKFKDLYQKVKANMNSREVTEFKKLASTLEEELNKQYIEYDMNSDANMLITAKEFKKRIEKLGLIYKIANEFEKDISNTKETRKKAKENKNKCIERVTNELLNICEFPNWNPKHYLDTAEIAYGVSIGYNWFFDELSDKNKETIEKALLEKALISSVTKERDEIFYKRENNWNQVCNSGIGIAAIVLLNTNYSIEEYEIKDVEVLEEINLDNKKATSKELAQAIIRRSIEGLELSKRQLEPNGGYLEGVEYWAYGTNYMIWFLSSLYQTYSTDFEFLNDQILEDTILFPIYITGKNSEKAKVFNYSDSNENIPEISCCLWLSEYYMNEDSNKEYLSYMSNWYAYKYRENFSVYEILLYDNTYGFENKTNEEIEKEIKLYNIPEDNVYNGQEVALLRTDFTNDEGIFVGIKGGDNQASHGDLDNGTIVLDALGVRWIEDLGPADYNLSGYWKEERWNYYPKRAEAHSTLSINPKDENKIGDQNVTAFSEIIENDFSDKLSYVKLDLSNIIDNNKNAKIERVLELNKESREVTITDTLENLESQEIYSFFNIAEGVSITLNENGKIATLEKENKKIEMILESSNDNLKFEVMQKKSLNSQVQNVSESKTKGNKIGIKINNTQEIKITFKIR